MKTITCAWLLLLTVCADARAELLFEGFMADPGSARFVLSNTETGRRSTWLAIGDSFDGHKVVSFDASSEILTLQRAGETRRLSLKPPSTLRTDRDPLQPPPDAILLYVGDNFRLLVNNDPSKLDRLRAELRRIAAVEPKPIVRIRTGTYSTMSLIHTVMDLCKENGLVKVGIEAIGATPP